MRSIRDFLLKQLFVFRVHTSRSHFTANSGYKEAPTNTPPATNSTSVTAASPKLQHRGCFPEITHKETRTRILRLRFIWTDTSWLGHIKSMTQLCKAHRPIIYILTQPRTFMHLNLLFNYLLPSLCTRSHCECKHCDTLCHIHAPVHALYFLYLYYFCFVLSFCYINSVLFYSCFSSFSSYG